MAQLSRRTYITTVFNGNLTAAVASSAVDGLAGLTVDMAGFEGAYFIGSLVQGGTGGAPTFQIRGSTAAIASMTSGGQGNAMTGASATLPTGSSATAEHVVIDVYKPRHGSGVNFLFPQWTIPSSCAQLGPAFCLQYEPTNLGNSTQTNSTSVRVIPQSTASSTAAPFMTGGVTAVVSPATS
mgnify:CR=1 FL=1